MTIPTEPIGSIPRPVKLLEAVATAGDNGDPKLDELYDAAIRDAIERFEATGSPVISDARTEKVIATSARTPFTAFPLSHPMVSRSRSLRATPAGCTDSHQDLFAIRGMPTHISMLPCFMRECRRAAAKPFRTAGG